MKIVRVTATPLQASFADLYGGEENVPASVRVPAAHFRKIPRFGQAATLVTVEAEDGTVGTGEAFGLPHPLAAAALIAHVVAPVIVGAQIDEPGAMTEDLYRYFFALGCTRGSTIEALSGLDIALWDLRARLAGVPLAALLGGTPGPVATYASPVAFHDDPADSAAAARAFADEGFAAIKVKIGRGAATDARHIGAVREAVGPDTRIFADANCAYDERSAIEVAEALAPYDLGWLEEPIPPDDPEALARVRKASPIPIAAGENEFTAGALRRLLDAGAVDFLQPNISRAGGVTGLLEAGRMCAAAGARLAPHGVGGCVAVSAALHVCRAAGAFAIYEANRLPNPLRDTLGVRPPSTQGGSLLASDGPGHGGEPQPSGVERYRIAEAAR